MKHTMKKADTILNIQPSDSSLQKYSQRIVFWFICLQPLFDIATFWAAKTSLPDIVAYLRLIPLLVLGIWYFLRVRPPVVDYVILSFIMVFIFLRPLLTKDMYPVSGIVEIQEAFRLFCMPVVMLWLYRLFAKEGAFLRNTAWNAVTVNGIIIAVSVALSLVTGTHQATYDQPWSQYGLNGWFLSGNAQSIILVSVLPLLLVSVLRYKQKPYPFFMLLSIAVIFLLLFMNGTRVAWYGLILLPIAVAVLYVIITLRTKKKINVITAVALLAMLFLCLGLKQFAPMMKTDTQRAFLLQQFKPDVSVNPQGSTGNTSAKPLTRNQVTWTQLSKNDRSAYTDIRSNSRLNVGRIDTIFYNYSTRVFHASANYRIDVRFRQTAFIHAAMSEASIATILFGYGSTFLAHAVGNIETDYAFIYGAYGITGSVILAGFLIFMLIRLIRSIRLRKILDYLDWERGTLLFVITLMLFAAFFAGRALQQPSVSVYLSVYMAMLVCSFEEIKNKDFSDSRRI